MSLANRAYRGLVRLMATVMLIVSMPIGAVQAGMVPTDQVIEQASVAEARSRVMEFLSRDDVRAQMQAMGIDPDEAAARAGAMTDAEVMQVAGQLDQLPAGQSAIGTVLGVFLLVLIILLFTDILGLTNVYPSI